MNTPSDKPDSSPMIASASFGFIADDALGCALQRIGEAALRKDVNMAINEALKLAREQFDISNAGQG